MPEMKRRQKSQAPDSRELDVEISFLEGLVRRDPGYVEALHLLGDDYTQRGRIAEGLQVDQRLTQLEPRNPLAFYNLGCSLALAGRLEESAQAVETALDLGYRDFKWLTSDPDLKALRKHPHFERLSEKMRRLCGQPE